MPITDGQSGKILRAGDTAVTQAEDGDWKHIGKGPFHNLIVQIHLPLDGTSITVDVEQADDSSGTNAESCTGFTKTITTGAVTLRYRIMPTRPYLRFNVDAVTGSFGAVQCSIGFGDKEKTS